ncbi:hypothetical protein [Dactylosporangium sp. NPDC048998]|uniref:hypothetical protein n=1 Tax=Dactylosporangium sp. NPDC048998 TaxID=3363976 RepID=UPI003719FE37
MSTVKSRIAVPFQGEGAGVAGMTWAQLGIWKTMVATGITMNIGGTVPLPPGTPVEEMTTLLRYLVSRHQSLRTRLRFAPDGTAEQVLSESGELGLELVDVGPGTTPRPPPRSCAPAMPRSRSTTSTSGRCGWGWCAATGR